MMDDQPQLNYIEGALMAALAAMIALVGFYIPPLQFVTVFIWLVPIVVISVRRGFYTGVLSLLVTAILLMILSPPWKAFLFILQFFGLGVVYAYLFSKQADFSKILMNGTLVVAVFTVLSVLLSFYIAGFSIVELTDTFEEVGDNAIAMYEKMGLLDSFEEQGMSREDIKEAVIKMTTSIAKSIPAIMVVYGMLVAFATYFISRHTLLRLKLPVGNLPKFRNWQLPWVFVWGIILGLAIMLLGDYQAWNLGMLIGRNILYAYLPVLIVQGLSVITFFYLKWKIPPFVKVLLVVIIVINLPLSLVVLLFIGLFDPLFNYRKLGVAKDGS